MKSKKRMDIILKKIILLIVAVLIVAGVLYAMYDIVNTTAMDPNSDFSNKKNENENEENSNVAGESKEQLEEKSEEQTEKQEANLPDGKAGIDINDKNMTSAEITLKEEYDETNASENNISDIQEQSEALKALKVFYGYLDLENGYNKAIDMLHDDFKMEIDILKSFGIKYLRKNDLKIDDATIYSDFVGAVKLKTIVNEESVPNTTPNSSVICYVQNVSIADMSVEQTIEAKLVEEDGMWKLLSLVEKAES